MANHVHSKPRGGVLAEGAVCSTLQVFSAVCFISLLKNSYKNQEFTLPFYGWEVDQRGWTGSTPYKQQSRCWNLGNPTQHFTTVLYCVLHKLCSETNKQTNKTPSSMRHFLFRCVRRCQQRCFLSDLDSKWFEKQESVEMKFTSLLRSDFEELEVWGLELLSRFTC